MPVATTADLLDALRQYRLLDPAQFAELGRTSPSGAPDARALARDLVGRGWLTPYQVNQLFQGRGEGLALGSYVLLDKLGEGGMGAVFKARHTRLGRVVALKIIRKERLGNELAVKRFVREIMAAAQLDHPNIIRAHDADEANGTHFFAMEYVEGTDLARLVEQRGPLPVPEACEHVRQAALGLQHAFERGLVHRDIKPANLLLTTTGVVKVLDMGLARLDAPAGGESISTLTQEGTVMGTPDYIAPEQALRSHDVDIRADLYSLGCTLFFLLSGRVPFPGGSLTEKLLRRQLNPAPDVRSRRPDVPEAVAAVAAKLMARRSAERYQTPAELALALDEVLRGLAVAPAAAGAERTLPDDADNPFADIDVPTTGAATVAPRPARKPRMLAVVGGLLLAGLLVPVLWWAAHRPPAGEADASSGRQPAPQELAAEAERKRRAEADEALNPLAEKAADPQTTFADFARDVQAFKAKYGGTPPAVRAATLLMKLRSPLDQLDPENIPEDVRAAWKADGFDGKDVVAVLGDHRRRHWAPVWSVVYSHDGKLIASGGDDPAVRVWDSETLQQRAVLRRERDRIRGLGFTPDSRQLFVASHDSTLWLWDVKTDRPPRAFLGNKHHSWSVAVSGDGRRVWGGGYDHAVRVWQVESGHEVRSFPGHKGWVNAIATFGDGRYALSGGEDSTIRLWDLEAGTEVRRFEDVPADNPVRTLALTGDGKRALSGHYQDSLIRVWDVETGKQIGQLQAHTRVTSVRFGADATRAVSGSSDGAVRLWDVEAGKELRRFEGHQGEVEGACLSPDGKRVASGGSDGVVRVWDVTSGKEVRPLTAPLMPVVSLAFSPDTRFLLAAEKEARLTRLWDVLAGASLRTLPGEGRVTDVAFAPTGRRFVAGSDNSAMQLWDLEKPDQARGFAMPKGWVSAVAYSPDGRRIACSGGSDGGALGVWDPEDGHDPGHYEPHKGELRSLAFSPDGRYLVGGGLGDPTVSVWDVTSGRRIRGMSTDGFDVTRVVISPDGRRVICGSKRPALRIFDLTGQAPPLGIDLYDQGQAVAVAVSPDGKQVASACALLRTVTVTDLASRTKVREWQLPGPVHALAFANDGRHLATANANGTVYILRLAGGPAKP